MIVRGTWLDHFGFGRQVEPNLKESRRIGFFRVQEWKHFRMHHTFAGRHPLQITFSVSTGISDGIGVINQTFNGRRDSLKSSVWMTWKAGNLISFHQGVVTVVRQTYNRVLRMAFADSFELTVDPWYMR